MLSPMLTSVHLLLLAATLTAPPQALLVQGRATNQAGIAVDGHYNVYMRFYAAEVEGEPLWEVLLPDEPLIGGRFDARLSGAPANLFTDHPAVWLGVSIATEPELPRQQLASVPWAIYAGTADVAVTAETAVTAQNALSADSAASADLLACTGCIQSAHLSDELALAWLDQANTFSALATFTSGVDLSWSQLTKFRVHNAAAAPVGCDEAHAGALYFDTTEKALRVCNGTDWVLGQAPTEPEVVAGTSCSSIQADGKSVGDGVYTIQTPAGDVSAWCDMTGGGWTWAAVLNTDLSGDNDTRIPTVQTFGTIGPSLPESAYSINIAGMTVTEVRLTNLTTGESIIESLAAPTVWPSETYTGGQGHAAFRVPLNAGWQFRTGYYVSGNQLIPLCFNGANISVAWVCDSDSFKARGMLDKGAGEFCGTTSKPKKWASANGTCIDYGSGYAVYAVAVR